MRHDTALDYRARITRVLRAIQIGVADDTDLTAPALARVAHFSPYHFSRVFRGMVGESISEHVRRIRLEKAAGELVRTDDQILAIALRCGYGSHEAFTRAFAAHFGEPPVSFRERAHDPIEFPPTPSCVHFGPDGALNVFVPLIKENPMLSVEIKEIAPKHLAAIRHTGPYTEVGAVFQRLMMWAGPKGLFGPNTEVLGVYHDDPKETAPEKLRCDACITAPPSFAGDEEAGVSVIEITPGECAVATFEGPYERLDEAYQWFFGTWLAQSGRTPGDRPPFECYLNSPMDTPPDKLRTQIHIPLCSET